MRLTVFLLLAATFQVSAGTYSQSVTLKVKNAPLEKVFNEIEKQSGFSFVYGKSDMVKANPVTVDVVNTDIEKVLSLIFKGQPLRYSISNKFVMIAPTAAFQPAEKKENTELPPPPNPDLTITVLNADNQPLEGASIIIKGQNKGIATDINGRATLRGIDPNATIIISFTGYSSQEFKISSSPGFKPGVTNLNALIRLAVSTSELDQVQIIAYGTTSKRLSTGNISTIKASDIEKQPVSNPLLALEGRVPGLFITQANGLAGGGVTVRIQGQNSILFGNDPLYVIDGIPYTSQNLLTGQGTILGGSGGPIINGIPSGNGNPLSFINPADIESIDVLKDADATAIYGSRAANGAILITTKKGKAGQTKVDINMQNGWGQITRTVPMMNTQQYLQMRHEAKRNDNAAVLSSDYDINGFWDTTRNTDWQKTLIGGTSQYTNITSGVSGGTTNMQYLVGGTFHRETTVFPGDFADQKASLHFYIGSTSANQKFKLQLSGNYLEDNNQLFNVDLTGTALIRAPDAPSLYNADGTLNWMPNAAGASTWTNPLSNLYNKYKNKTNNLISNAVLSYQILPGLEIKSSFGYTNLKSNEITTTPLVYYAPEIRPLVQSNAIYSNSTLESWIIEPQALYKRNIGKGRVDALLGTTIQQNTSNVLGVIGNGYNSDLLLEDINSAATVSKYASLVSIYKYNALYGWINYNWQDKFIVNFIARRDGSSRFGLANQFHNFGSVGGAWIFSKEDFIQKKLSFLSFGKLRASYGTTGNDQIGDYQFLNQLIASPGLAYQGATGLGINGLTNPYLQWEETKKLQFGLDLGLFKDRILLSVNYFYNRSSNELLPYNLPVITGFGSIIRNFPATVQNSGWEFSFNTSNFKTKDFSWSINFNLTIPQNKLIDFSNLATSSYASTFIIGQPITLRRVYHFLGVDPATGKYQVTNSHGDPSSNPNPLTDRTVLINTLPKFYGGFQNSFSYKGIQLDFLFQFIKQKGFGTFFFGNIGGARFNTNEPVSVIGRWQKPGDVTNIQRYSTSLISISSIISPSDAGYGDASYIRLKNLSLSWQLPGKWRNKAHLQNCRLYVQGQNLLTITNYKGGLDPETQSASSLPLLRVLTIGIQMTL